MQFLNGMKNFPYGSLEIEWPNGKVEKISANKSGPKANLKITDKNVVKEIINGGSVKFAELYMAKRLTSSNLTTLMYYFALNNNEAEDTFKLSIFKYFPREINFQNLLSSEVITPRNFLSLNFLSPINLI